MLEGLSSNLAQVRSRTEIIAPEFVEELVLHPRPRPWRQDTQSVQHLTSDINCSNQVAVVFACLDETERPAESEAPYHIEGQKIG
jgi:hypothetical protein